jgi:hypothetical protein
VRQHAKAEFASSSQRVREVSIAALDDMLVETTRTSDRSRLLSSWGGAAGEHGDVCIRRKETCRR